VDPWSLLQTFGQDGVRYYLLAELNLLQDSNFSPLAMRQKLNAELADTLGNLVKRCSAPSLNPQVFFSFFFPCSDLSFGRFFFFIFF
jgi:methionyl-tRNA synthetase